MTGKKTMEAVDVSKQDFLTGELKKFTSIDPKKKHLAQIMRYAEYAFATDGVTMAFTEKLCLDSIPDSGLKRNDLLSQVIEQHQLLQFDLIGMPILDLNACKRCQGSGLVCEKECFECEGNGCLTIQSDYNEYQVVCKTCNGNGMFTSRDREDVAACGCVNGYQFNGYEEIKGVDVDSRYLFTIKDYPSLHVACAHLESARAKMIHFRSGNGIQGVIMGVVT